MVSPVFLSPRAAGRVDGERHFDGTRDGPSAKCRKLTRAGGASRREGSGWELDGMSGRNTHSARSGRKTTILRHFFFELHSRNNQTTRET